MGKFHTRRERLAQANGSEACDRASGAITLAKCRLTQLESTPPAGTVELRNNHGPQQRAALMKRTTKYVGLDVHQAMTVATVRSEGGRVIARSVVETSDESIREFFSAMAGSVHVAFEEGTQAQWLYDLLSPRVDRVIDSGARSRSRAGYAVWASSRSATRRSTATSGVIEDRVAASTGTCAVLPNSAENGTAPTIPEGGWLESGRYLNVQLEHRTEPESATSKPIP